MYYFTLNSALVKYLILILLSLICGDIHIEAYDINMSIYLKEIFKWNPCGIRTVQCFDWWQIHEFTQVIKPIELNTHIYQ